MQLLDEDDQKENRQVLKNLETKNEVKPLFELTNSRVLVNELSNASEKF